MKKESIEALRARLLEDEALQYRIQIRAFEIYQSRGARPGNPQLDWLQAENETLMLLIEQESRLASPNDGGVPIGALNDDSPSPVVKSRAPRRATAAKKPTSKSEPTQQASKKKPSKPRKTQSKTK